MTEAEWSLKMKLAICDKCGATVGEIAAQARINGGIWCYNSPPCPMKRADIAAYMLPKDLETLKERP
jgi:hypothetical protein